jgi:hypothetical protein
MHRHALPISYTYVRFGFPIAEVAQLVELLLPKQVVVGSSPIFRFA